MKPQTLSIVRELFPVPCVNYTCHPYCHTGTPGESQGLDSGTENFSSPETASPPSLHGWDRCSPKGKLTLWKSFCSGTASCISLPADGEKAHPKVLQGLFESSARTEGKLFKKIISLCCWKWWLYLSQNIYDSCMSIWDTKQLICKQQS